MYTHLNSGYLRTLPLWNQNVKYFTWCDVHFHESANRMNMALPCGVLEFVKQSCDGTLDARTMQYNFEVVLEIRDCVRSPKAVAV
jgi:hypothetical protein